MKNNARVVAHNDQDKPSTSTKVKRVRWNPKTHAARIDKILGGKNFPSLDEHLANERADRKL